MQGRIEQQRFEALLPLLTVLNAAWQAVFFDFPAMAVFVFAAVAAQSINEDRALPRWLCWGLVALAFALPVYVGWKVQQESSKAIREVA